MKALDTNILIYAHRKEVPEHKLALDLLTKLTEGHDAWALTWTSCYEFIKVVTSPSAFRIPTTLNSALDFLESIFDSPTVRVLGPGNNHWDWMKQAIKEGDARGNLAFDAEIAAILLEHSVNQIVTRDGDFRRFRDLQVENPFERQ